MHAGRALIVLGLLLLGAGLWLSFGTLTARRGASGAEAARHRKQGTFTDVPWGGKLSFRPGRLPGDFVIRGKNSVFYLPLATSLLVSAAATLVFWLLRRRP